MKRIVLTFGLIAGAILSAMMLLSLPFADSIGFERAEIIGYTSMVAAFLMIFFGIRSYRDNVAGGAIGFGRAFAVGALIAAVAAVCYSVTWQFVYYKLVPDFGARYQAHLIDKARKNGDSEESIARQKAEMDRFARLFENPAINAAIAFVEPLPVAIVVTLISAGVLSRRKK